MRVTIILVDSELERIPEGVQVKPRCDINTKVLESYLHKDVLATMPEGSRRGRPDMVHGFLNLCQSSIANKRGHLRVFVHTRNDEILTIGQKAHVPQNYLEYLGFMDELLEKGKIGSGEEEISISKGTYLELMDQINVDVTVDGSQTYGGSPTFTSTNDAPGGVTVSGTAAPTAGSTTNPSGAPSTTPSTP